ncbi:chromosome transmission fidelity protein 18 homolog [Papaver somniferum]|uniref:chromosome transmission fidelity protein 18 homolog n=1 Tax=Papaver somniferum TaxID=3469 RepID=UPI000E6FB62B|nr:chromosome transmission fidelity protein 18 homolog [Papaver somniferum]
MDDIPLPDELEWLESNSLLPEEEEEIYEEYEEELEVVVPQQNPSSSSRETGITSSLQSQISDNNENNKKRPWSNLKENPNNTNNNNVDYLDAKRNKVIPPPPPPSRQGGKVGGGAEIEMEEEDWLRYSPPPQPPSPVKAAVQEKFVYRFASEIDGNCIPVTGPSGDRVYTKIISYQQNEMLNNDLKRLTTRTKGLISVPVTVLMERLEQDALSKALQDSSGSSTNLIDSPSSVVTEQLWVNKYAPNSFTDLLSDEQTNREVLLWLKQWDSCVFGSEIRSTTDDVLTALRRHSTLAHHQKLSGTNPNGKNRTPYSTNKSYKRPDSSYGEEQNIKSIQESWNNRLTVTSPPDHKVLLLCGPPGLGKTTLAHVAAKHCGYRVVEINASDDRSSSSIEAKILDVVQMNSVMADAKPKCLIIDEIDGALGEGKGAVEVIMKMIAAEKKYEAGKENVAQKEQHGKVSSKRGKKSATLSRPVICICNDLFAPALRPLRQVAKVHMFVKPTVNRVVSRLKYICNMEGFRTSSTALTALAAHTECDIRSCLNTLQFLNKKKEILNAADISSQVGHKDMSKSVFDVWREVFHKRKPKGELKPMASAVSSDFDFLHSLITNCGDYDLTMDGIHENILQLHYHDPMMQKTVKCINTLGVSDHLHQYIMRTQQMSLLAYQPSSAISIGRVIAQIQKPNIEWPKSSQRYRLLIEKKDLLKCWCSKIPPSISRHLSAESFVGDAVSLLLYILSPPTLRPVALHLLSEREKNDMSQLVNTMVSFSISYKNMNPQTPANTPRYGAALDAPTLSLDPPIGNFINFKDYVSDHFGLSLAVKQLLVHEVEKQKILSGSINSRSDHSNDGESNTIEGDGKALSTKVKNKTSNGVQSTEVPKGQLTPGHQCDEENINIARNMTPSTSGSNTSVAAGNIEVKASLSVAKKKHCGASSFFDRLRKGGGKNSVNAGNALQKSATIERDSRPLIFKFNEGFTNAVKKPVRISELL